VLEISPNVLIQAAFVQGSVCRGEILCPVGRFKSQALLDEKALTACLAYVDMNPEHAKMAQTPESSEYASIAERIVVVKANGSNNKRLFPKLSSKLSRHPSLTCQKISNMAIS
jgi:hypothetical protein